MLGFYEINDADYLAKLICKSLLLFRLTKIQNGRVLLIQTIKLNPDCANVCRPIIFDFPIRSDEFCQVGFSDVRVIQRGTTFCDVL